MTVKKYNKLVRDKIPSIIEANGKYCKFYVAKKSDYIRKLKEKLLEEIQEFFENPCVEELADVQEVINALTYVNGWDVPSARFKKNRLRGAFGRRYILEEVHE